MRAGVYGSEVEHLPSMFQVSGSALKELKKKLKSNGVTKVGM